MLKRVLMAGLGLAAVASIAIAAQPPQSARPGTPPPGQSPAVVKLSLNQDVNVENNGTRLKLRMTDVKDSRCPSDVVCIRAGEAIVTVTVTPLAAGQADKASTVSLSLPGEPQSAAGALFTLQTVEPYPKASQPTPPAQYVATVQVAQGKG
jgi:hypothetical protein